MKSFKISKKFVNNDEELDLQENENYPINKIDNSNVRNKNNKGINSNCIYFLSILLFFICIILIVIYLKIYFNESKVINNIKYKRQTDFDIFNISNKTNISEIEIPDKMIKFHDTKEIDNISKKIQQEVYKFSKPMNKSNEKIGVAFVYKYLYGNGIGRMLSLLCSDLAKLEIYDIYILTGESHPSIDFHFDKRVIKVPLIDNKTLIQQYDKDSNIKIYILQNDLTPSSISWYKNLNGGKKVIGIVHGVYMSSIFANLTGVYSIWKYLSLYDAYIQVNADDYYVNKRLGINNSFFLPNLYTYDPDTTKNSNLTYNNLVIIGRELDKIKGGLYGIKAMDIIRREVPDAKMYFISSNYKITFLENLIKELNLTHNIERLYFTKNISKYFWNSSIFVNPSLSEACPMVVNEAKAHGLPIVGFNVSYSIPYQTGAITVEVTNYTQMAEECIKLLKDYNYRKKMGMEAKLSMKRMSNNETIQRWSQLFEVLVNNDMEGYKKLQELTFEKKYYDEESARDHLESNWKQGQIFNRYFCCHDFNDMLNITYINSIKGCKNQSLCK